MYLYNLTLSRASAITVRRGRGPPSPLRRGRGAWHPHPHRRGVPMRAAPGHTPGRQQRSAWASGARRCRPMAVQQRRAGRTAPAARR